MKSTLLALAAATITAGSLFATNISTDFYWGNQTSNTAFSVTIAGTGLSWHDTFTSPSGLWEGNIWLNAEYNPERSESHPINSVHVRGYMTFLGSPDHPYLYAPGYNDFFEIADRIYDSNHFSADLGRGFPLDWSGQTPYVIMPNGSTDPSDWDWVLNLSAHGSPLQRVPDYSNTGLCLAFAAGLLLLFKARQGIENL